MYCYMILAVSCHSSTGWTSGKIYIAVFFDVTTKCSWLYKCTYLKLGNSPYRSIQLLPDPCKVSSQPHRPTTLTSLKVQFIFSSWMNWYTHSRILHFPILDQKLTVFLSVTMRAARLIWNKTWMILTHFGKEPLSFRRFQLLRLHVYEL